MTIGASIRLAREGAGMSQLELARAVGDVDPLLARTDSSRISDWERDRTPRIPWYAVVAVARATATSLDDLIANAERYAS